MNKSILSVLLDLDIKNGNIVVRATKRMDVLALYIFQNIACLLFIVFGFHITRNSHIYRSAQLRAFLHLPERS